MLVLRYFAWVGAVLLVALFVADYRLPRAELRVQPEQDLNIRIKSAAPAPEPITFSGHAVDHGPPPPLQVVDLAANAATVSPPDDARANAKQAFAQATRETQIAKPAPQRPRKQYAKRRIMPRPEEPRVVEASDWWRPWSRFE